MPFLSKFSLRTLFTSAILALSLTPLLIVSFSAWRIANNTAEEKANIYASAAKNIADKIDRNLFERYGDVQAFGLNHALRSRESWYDQSESSPIVRVMNSYVDTYDIYDLTILVDLNGRLIAANSKDQDGEPIDSSILQDHDFSNEEWFQNCSQGKFYESEDGSFTGTVVEHLYVDEFAKQIYGNEGLALGYSAPVYDEDGEVLAYWKNVTKFSLVEEILFAAYDELSEQGTPSAEITLLDEVGNVIIDCDPSVSGEREVHRDLDVIGKFNLAKKNVVAAQKVVDGEEGSILKSWHARKKINQVAGFAPLTGALGFPGMKWNVLVRVPESEAFATAIKAKSLILWTSIVFTAIVICFVFWVTGVAGRVLARVIDSMAAASEGDFTQKVTTRVACDVSAMTDALNRLLDDLSNASDRNADYRNQIETISKSQAVIRFEPDGTILDANENLLSVLGYELDEVVGEHHRLLCDSEFSQSKEYRELWERVRSGETYSGDFKRVSKSGQEVWVRGSYHGIEAQDGGLDYAVLYATDITSSKRMELELEESREKERLATEEQKRKVAKLLDVVNQVAQGDLAVEVPDLGEDSIGQIASSVEQVVESICKVMQEVRTVSGTVADVASEMTMTSEHISGGAQTQAASLEQTAASLEEITSAVKLNTDNSQQAQQLSSSSRETAQSGGDVVGEAVEAMTAISTSSKKIAEIIGTIDKIAFQTNLLALNAAVEAARAGEQGRGFAVVASEVQSLAQRSASAAKEIKTLIQDSVEKVQNGTELVNRSGETLGEIVTSVKRVADIVSEISAASSEQLTGIEQVNQAVSQMDRVTQTNASQTEEMTLTSRRLMGHSNRLRELIGKFRMGGDEDMSAASTGTESSEKYSVGASCAVEDSGFDRQSALPVGAHELDTIGVGADSEFEDF